METTVAMSDSFGSGGNSSSDGGGTINTTGGVGAGHDTLSGAVEHADKAVRHVASSIVGSGDIDWNLLRDDFSRLAHKLHALNVTSLHLRLNQFEPGDLCIMGFLQLGNLRVPLTLHMPGAFDPAKADERDSQQDDSPDADE